jgi:molecular chaperone GrpE
MSAMDEATKEALCAQFRAYLDASEAGGDRPGDDGAADDGAGSQSDAPAPDLFTLLAELTALKGEVKIESRQVKTALDEFRALFDTLRESQARLTDEQERRCEQQRSAERQGWRALLLDLLDLRDRLQVGQQQAERHRPGWLARRGRTARRLVALSEGMALSLRRLDDALARRDLRPLPALGQPFDPRTMNAAQITRNPAHPNGEVIEELRPGWLLGADLLRPAEVVVNRVDQPEP